MIEILATKLIKNNNILVSSDFDQTLLCRCLILLLIFFLCVQPHSASFLQSLASIIDSLCFSCKTYASDGVFLLAAVASV